MFCLLHAAEGKYNLENLEENGVQYIVYLK